MRILFITSTRIGDAVLSSGVLAHLIERYPGSEITVACGPLAAPLFRHAPQVTHVHEMRKAKFGGHWRGLLSETRDTRWDMVIDLRGSATSYFLRAKSRHVLRPDHNLHRVRHAASVLELDPPPAPRLWPGEEARATARTIVPDGRLAIAVGPTAHWPGKAWPVERFKALVGRLTAPGAPLADALVLVEGGPGEEPAAGPLLGAIPPERLVNQIGSDLLTAYACFERVALYVGNDSGLMHLAAAAGAPTLGLFGPTRDDLYAPWGEHAAFVRGPRSFEEITSDPTYVTWGPQNFMLDLSVDKAAAAAAALIERTGIRRAGEALPLLETRQAAE